MCSGKVFLWETWGTNGDRGRRRREGAEERWWDIRSLDRLDSAVKITSQLAFWTSRAL
jgi:hypothetical protein